MDYKKLHKDTITKLQEMVNSGKITVEVARGICADFEPESEDERIRKALIEMVHDTTGDDLWVDYGIHKEEAHAWLEKQGEPKDEEIVGEDRHYIETIEYAIKNTFKDKENPHRQSALGWLKKKCEQKPTIEMKSAEESLGISSEEYNKIVDKLIYDEQKPDDKVEPKFKVGDWIVNNGDGDDVCRITNILTDLDSSDEFSYEHTEGCFHNSFEDSFHLWTIKDAKAGDVLAAHECLVLFKEIDGLNIRCYCTYHFMNNPSFYVDTLQNKDAFHPATKEQRDTLERAMTNAGYRWNKEKLKLEKI